MPTIAASSVCTQIVINGNTYNGSGDIFAGVNADDTTALVARHNLPELVSSAPGNPATVTFQLQPEITSITFATAGTLIPAAGLITLSEPEASSFAYGPSFGKQHIPFQYVTG